MSQSLQLTPKLTQALIMAPQMQQSLALLQAPTLELKALVEQELQRNPILEEATVQEVEQEEKVALGAPGPAEAADPSEPPSDVKFDPATENSSNAPVDDFQAEFERLSQMDQEWRDRFGETNIPLRSHAESEEKRQFMFDSIVAGESLQETLLEQMRLSELQPEQWPLAELIIGNIDDFGYLKISAEELTTITNLPAGDIEKVLQIIQSFHPPGVGARDIRECLLLQLERAGRTGSLEYRIVRDCMELLGKRKLPDIARALGVGIDVIQQATASIGHLEPRPGRAFLPDNDIYVMPEVFIQKVGEEYVVSLNNEQIPHLRISNKYKDIMANPESAEEVREYIRDKIRAGKYLIKSLHQRQQTITNIAREIVLRQRDFFDKGVAHLKPMTMVQVAEAVGVHETTVSRAVSNKYMETPQGIFEMKYFFTSGIQTASGAGMSNTSVKDMIEEMFRNEDTTHPISDQEVVEMVKAKGVMIARRTVAKYRTELNILPSSLRRVYSASPRSSAPPAAPRPGA